MKIAVTGKGGAGKTTVASILARTLARRGDEVVAVDADPSPNLGIALGLGAAQTERLEGIVNELLRQKAAHGHHHHDDGDDHDHAACDPPKEKTADDLIAEMGVIAPDGVRLVQTGRIEKPAGGCLCCGSHGTTRRIFNDIDARDRLVVADLEAGVNDLLWAYPKPEDTVLIVTEPYRKSLEVTKRALDVTRSLGVARVMVVANRIESDDDLRLVSEAVDGAEIHVVPEDRAVRAADRAGRSPVDAAAGAPAVVAVEKLARQVVGDTAASAGTVGAT